MHALQQSSRSTQLLPADRFIQVHRPDAESVREELLAGLMAERASISPKYLYDPLGSRLFEAICELPEYYPTRTESAIFDTFRDDIRNAVPPGATLIDLGAGNCRKAAALFDVLRPAQYVAVDISIDFLRNAVHQLHICHPDIDMVGVGMDFSATLDLPAEVRRANRLFFYPGSSIGNFSPGEASAFLGRLRNAGSPQAGLLIGVDLLKDASELHAAYDDALGVTAAFNRNLLLHVNRLLGANFNVDDWRHDCVVNAVHERVEMHLIARRDVAVTWNGGGRSFVEGEGLHTENSYKYRRETFIAMLERAGFHDVRSWTDEHRRYMVCHATARADCAD